MQSLGTVGLLSFMLIFQPSLVRSESFNLGQIVLCLQTAMEAVAEVCTKSLPLARDLFTCVNYVAVENLHDLDTKGFRKVVSGFIKKLVEGPSCLETFGESMMDIIKPHNALFNTYKCAYLGVPPQCVPKNKERS